MSHMGQSDDFGAQTDVRFTPESGHQGGRDRCPLCAISDQGAGPPLNRQPL